MERARLTSRENQVLQLIMEEYTTSEIAGKLQLSIETVKTHRRHLRNKLKARNTAGIVRRAFEYHLVDDLNNAVR